MEEELMRNHRIAVIAAALGLVAAACSGSSTTPAPSLPTSLGAGEGQVSVLNWPGYVENGSTDPAYDWVTDFEKETGCKVTAQPFGTSDEAFSLFSTNPEKYDVISASGDASKRLALGGYVQPINVDLIKNYGDIFPALKDKPWNTFDGVHYGIPHGRGANLLMWRTDKVNPAPTSWTDMFDPNSPQKNHISVYDAPIYLADAAVVLMKTNPELGIKNPYALDEKQFAAVVDLAKKQKPIIGEYWTDYVKQQEAFTQGNSTLGTTWQVITNLLQGSDPAVPVQAIKPAEGATGWSDTWMINAKTKHPNCAYMLIDHLVSAATNDAIAEYFGEAPANSKACAVSDAAKASCDTFHASDDAYWTNVWYWTTPEEKCLDGRTDVKCKGFDAWIKAWTEIKGS
jgi:putative spermidine/putrescine transport system substrate-binding protein